MNASKYNAKQYQDGNLTDAMVTKLVQCWQRHNDLAVDGFAGPNTLHSLMSSGSGSLVKYFPLRLLGDGRKPVITSGFYTENPSRSTHHGVDFFYPWHSGDPLVPVGDGGAVAKRGERRWWIPEGTYAVAAADGIVQVAADSKTGHKVWIDHGNGERTGYFHLINCTVMPGDTVSAGTALGVVGDNPSGHDATHLHFEVSPAHRYAPVNPRTWLEGATYLSA